MLRALALTCVILQLPAAAARLELEVGAGAESRAAAPMLTGRVGVDFFDWLTPSLRAFAVSPPGGDVSAWALAGELRAHTRGRVQMFGALGLALGNAYLFAENDTYSARMVRQGAYLLGELGARLRLFDFFLGLSVGGSPLSDRFLVTASLTWAGLGTRSD